MSKICSKCGTHEILAKGMCQRCYSKQYYLDNKNKLIIRTTEWRKNNPEKYKAIYTRNHRKTGMLPMSENKKCTSYLGVHVAERVLSHVFENVIRQPYGNPGFDFVCNKGMKIDVKSSCLNFDRRDKTTHWMFNIKKNKIADYFLCLAFDNRKDLNPVHIWLIPADNINHFVGAVISPSTVDKWNQYIISMDKVSYCCDGLRNGRFK